MLSYRNENEGASVFSHLTDYVNCIYNEPFLNYSLPSDYVINKTPNTLHFALQYIFTNYLAIKNTSEVARNSHISISYLCQIFRKHMNCSPIDFINSCKISHAKHLLLNGHSATEVCYLSGFNHYNYFAETFKRNVGFSPRKFCKNYRQYFIFMSQNAN